MAPTELWGVTEIAKAYGVKPQRVDYWTGTPRFPKPAYELANGRIWRASAVRRWVVKYRRELVEVSPGLQ
jgi:hypothetical protein